jgi:mono/diheme cytochrome c family protein
MRRPSTAFPPLPFGERVGVRGQPRRKVPTLHESIRAIALCNSMIHGKPGPSPQPSPRRGEGAKRAAIAFLCAIALSFLHTGTAHAQSSDNAFYTQANIKDANGEAIFHHICQGCHMPDAKGATGAGTYPALTGNPKLVSPQYMAAVILFGRHDMPSFETKPTTHSGFFQNTMLSDEQIAEVINYVRTHFGNTYSNSITAAEVAAMHPQDQPSATKP